MRIAFLFVPLFLAASAWSQLAVIGTVPSDGTTNVAVHARLAIAFNMPIDTSASLVDGRNIMTNIDNIERIWYGELSDTVYVDAVLHPNTSYFILLYSVHSATGGDTLPVPYVAYFTTAASFPMYSVSGSVSCGATSHQPGHAIVAISSTPIGNREPRWITATVADASGAFVLPHVKDGVYFPAAALDLNRDGYIDPSTCDIAASGDSITVSSGNVSAVMLEFEERRPVTWDRALITLDLLKSQLPADKVLKFIQSRNVDSLGCAVDTWEFEFMRTLDSSAFAVDVGVFGTFINQITDEIRTDWLVRQQTAILDPDFFAPPDVLIENAEAAGGYVFRTEPHPADWRFQRSLMLCRLWNTDLWMYAPDPESLYWALQYMFYEPIGADSDVIRKEKVFVADIGTGNLRVVTSVERAADRSRPTAFELGQNYPNPCNPDTRMTYRIPVQSHVTIEVYNLIGQRVATLANGVMSPGEYNVEWKPDVSSGIYVCRMEAVPAAPDAQPFTAARKMTLIR